MPIGLFSRAPLKIAGLLFLILTLFLVGSQALAQDATNPAGTTIPNWDGTTEDDNYDNQGTVTEQVDMTQGGHDSFLNVGGVGGDVVMSSDGFNTVENQSTAMVGGSIYGSKNVTIGSTDDDDPGDDDEIPGNDPRR